MSNSSAAPAVKFTGVTKRYGTAGPLVIDQLDLQIERGDFVSFIGPSGCGKSTLLKLVSGLSPISSGQLTVNSLLPIHAREELFYVFQEPTLLPWLPAVQNVEMPLLLSGRKSPAERRMLAREMLELVGLGDRVNYYPRQLSGGQKMRVSIARALSVSPKILLMDEPFGALDEMTRDHLNEELLAIRERRRWTGLFVTHSVAEAVFLSNRIVVLSANPGRLHSEIQVDLPHPRSADTRSAPEYLRLVAEVSRLLRSVERLTPAPSP